MGSCQWCSSNVLRSVDDLVVDNKVIWVTEAVNIAKAFDNYVLSVVKNVISIGGICSDATYGNDFVHKTVFSWIQSLTMRS